jgi:rhodanese-related sulfurtransferase
MPAFKRKMNLQTLVLLALALAGAFIVLRPLLLGSPRISASEAQSLVATGSAVVVDVREPGEWRSGVAAPAVLLPLGDLMGSRKLWAPFLAENRGKRIIVYCASGIRSGNAATILRREGFDVANLGGFSSWASAGLPTRQP